MKTSIVLALLVVTLPAGAQTTHVVDRQGSCGGAAPCHTSLAAAVAAAADGDTIEVRAGRYPEAVAIGSRAGLTVIGPPDGVRTMSCQVGPQSGHAEIAGLVTLHDTDGLRFEDLVFSGGLRATGGTTGSVFVRNDFRSLLHFVNCWQSDIRQNRFDGAAGGALAVDTVGECRFTQNVFVDDAEARIGDLNSTDVEVIENFFYGGVLAVRGERLRSPRVAGNRLNGAPLVVEAQWLLEDARIEDNVIGGAGLSIAVASTATGNRVSGNHVTGSDGDGIRVEVISGGFDNTITGNTARGHAGCDIRDDSTVGIVDNDWSDNEFDTACGAADG